MDKTPKKRGPKSPYDESLGNCIKMGPAVPRPVHAAMQKPENKILMNEVIMDPVFGKVAQELALENRAERLSLKVNDEELA